MSRHRRARPQRASLLFLSPPSSFFPPSLSFPSSLCYPIRRELLRWIPSASTVATSDDSLTSAVDPSLHLSAGRLARSIARRRWKCSSFTVSPPPRRPRPLAPPLMSAANPACTAPAAVQLVGEDFAPVERVDPSDVRQPAPLNGPLAVRPSSSHFSLLWYSHGFLTRFFFLESMIIYES